MAEYQYPDWNGVLQKEGAVTHYARLISLAGVLLSFGGFMFSPALVSIGVAIIAAPVLVAFPPKEQLKRFWDHKPAFFLSLIFFVHLLSGLWTREYSADKYLEQSIIKLPLFTTSYAFAVLGPVPLRWIRILLMVTLLASFITAGGAVIDYFLHREAINEAILSSKEISIWTGINHIYFSVICGFATLSVLWLVRFKNPALFRGEKLAVVILGIANFAFMHILTTRTGLVGVYGTLMILGIVWVVQTKKYLIGVIGFTVLMTLPLVGYYSIPSFQRRLDNSIVDVTRYFRGKDPNYLSIGTRIESWKAAFHIFQDNPLIGVGMGDIKEAMTEQYIKDQTRLCPENFVTAHNQFLLFLAGYGLLGFAPFLAAWLYPLFQRKVTRTWLFWGFWIVMTLSMAGESMLERQRGVNFIVAVFMIAYGAGVNWPGQDKTSWR